MSTRQSNHTTFNFDEVVDRHNTFSYKWDSFADHDILPLWVADMDFKTAPMIQEAVMKVAAHGIYGYATEPEAFYDAIIGFHKRHYEGVVKRESILYAPGVVPALSAVLQGLFLNGDEVVVLTPAYNNFFSSLRNSGLYTSECPLIYQNGVYSIDFESLERLCASKKARCLLLCNPHNPSGRLWNKEELERILAIVKKNNLIVISDEIHCDIRPNHKNFYPFYKIADDYWDKVITLCSPSKPFNIAGLHCAYVLCDNKDLRERIFQSININEICDGNAFGYAALIAAYTKCDDWLYALNDYIQKNYMYLVEFMRMNFKDLIVLPLESTYLAFVDCKALGLCDVEIKEKLLKESGLYINDGSMYHCKEKSFIRINLACPLCVLKDALSRFKKTFTKKL